MLTRMLAALDKYSAQYYPELSLISAADRKGYTPLHWACYYGEFNTYTTINSVCMRFSYPCQLENLSWGQRPCGL